MTGIDVLEREDFARLKGKKVGLVTNHTGRDRDGRATIDLLHKAEGVKLVALFSPEHGIRGAVDENVGDTKDEKTGLPVYSLYGPRRKPTAELLEGHRHARLRHSGRRLPLLHLHQHARPDPGSGGREQDQGRSCSTGPTRSAVSPLPGPVRDANMESSFVAWHTLPLRHGLTVGELARLFKDERHIDVDLEVVKCEGWQRADFYDKTLLAVDQPVAEHAVADAGAALSRHRLAGDDQHQRRPRDRSAVRVDRRPVDRRRDGSRRRSPSGSCPACASCRCRGRRPAPPMRRKSAAACRSSSTTGRRSSRSAPG